MKTNDIRRWLIARRDALIYERDHIQPRIDNLNLLIAEVEAGPVVTAPPNPPPVERRKKVPAAAEAATLLALEAAGEAGLSGRELAAVAQLPVGTASARLTILKQAGVVRHDAKLARYFVTHSKQEDNNIQ
jgi:hypothetical protein